MAKDKTKADAKRSADEEARLRELASARRNIELFFDKADRFALRALNSFLTNRVSSDFATQRGTMVVIAKNPMTRNMASGISFLDTILHEGTSGLGDPRNGGIAEYGAKLIKIMGEVDTLGQSIKNISDKALEEQIGPRWAQLLYLQNSVIEKFGVTENQAERLIREANKVGEKALDYATKQEAEAKKAGQTLREYMIAQATAREAEERSKKQQQPQPVNQSKNVNQAAPQDKQAAEKKGGGAKAEQQATQPKDESAGEAKAS